MEDMLTLIVRTELMFNKICAIDARLKQIGKAESLVEETKQVFIQYEK